MWLINSLVITPADWTSEVALLLRIYGDLDNAWVSDEKLYALYVLYGGANPRQQDPVSLIREVREKWNIRAIGHNVGDLHRDGLVADGCIVKGKHRLCTRHGRGTQQEHRVHPDYAKNLYVKEQPPRLPTLQDILPTEFASLRSHPSLPIHDGGHQQSQRIKSQQIPFPPTCRAATSSTSSASTTSSSGSVYHLASSMGPDILQKSTTLTHPAAAVWRDVSERVDRRVAWILEKADAWMVEEGNRNETAVNALRAEFTSKMKEQTEVISALRGEMDRLKEAMRGNAIIKQMPPKEDPRQEPPVSEQRQANIAHKSSPSLPTAPNPTTVIVLDDDESALPAMANRGAHAGSEEEERGNQIKSLFGLPETAKVRDLRARWRGGEYVNLLDMLRKHQYLKALSDQGLFKRRLLRHVPVIQYQGRDYGARG